MLLPALFSCRSRESITEENYLKADSTIWLTYERETEALAECMKKYPEKRDSLKIVAEQVLEIALRKNEALAIKYATTPSGLQRVYMVRLNLSKDTLRAVLETLPKEMQNSPYGKSILAHIKNEQIEEGSPYYDFTATDTNGREFHLSSLSGKNMLLLYGGVDCMGQEGRDFLSSLYHKTSRSNFEIVIYWPCSSLERLKNLKEHFSDDYIYVSDFLQDHSLFKIIYGAQATPTCFVINKEGTVITKSTGLPVEQLKALLENKFFD
jgi:peroxiredoxin